MTRLDALKALAEKAEAGIGMATGDVCAMRASLPSAIVAWRKQIVEAYYGSLDAAKALHEAVLPEWAVERISWWPGNGAKVHLWGTHEERGGRWHSAEDGRAEATAETIARAWLLAILRALIAQEEGQ